MLDDFRLRVFMMVAAESSFTRAAQHLGVTQPAVSQHIAELEKQGCKLEGTCEIKDRYGFEDDMIPAFKMSL